MTEDAMRQQISHLRNVNEALEKKIAEKENNLNADPWEQTRAALIARIEKVEATLLAEFRQSAVVAVPARRITEDEFKYMEKLEFINGRLMTPSGVELFVGVKEFPESIRALKQEQEEREGKSIGEYREAS